MYEDTLWEEQHALMEELDADNQHCHTCAYWSERYETEKEPHDRGECQNPWEKKHYGKRPRRRWCPAWSREYKHPEEEVEIKSYTLLNGTTYSYRGKKIEKKVIPNE